MSAEKLALTSAMRSSEPSWMLAEPEAVEALAPAGVRSEARKSVGWLKKRVTTALRSAESA